MNLPTPHVSPGLELREEAVPGAGTPSAAERPVHRSP